MVIEDGKSVSIEYTLNLDDGTEVDTNVGKEPLVYEQGKGQIIPGLEKAMAGMREGDSKTVTIPAEDGYGPVDPNAFREVKTEQIPEGARQVGTLLTAEGHSGPIRVHELRGEIVVLDFNHPLAGENLNFEVRVVAVS